MIEKLDSKMEYVELTVLEKKAECLDFEAARKLNSKINELVDAVNLLQCKNIHIESDLQDLMYPKEIKGELAENTTISKMENVQDEMPRCPFCGEKLQEDIGYDGDYSCPKCRTPYFGSPELWQELIRTRKALDVAVDALKELKETVSNTEQELDMTIQAANALEQITALEQKE